VASRRPRTHHERVILLAPRRVAVLAALSAAIACGGSGDGDTPRGTSPLTAAERDALVVEHDSVRAAAQPAPDPPLSALAWSDAAAGVAQGWADGCAYGHNPGRGALGENIAASTPPGSLSAPEVVALWADEAASYDYASNACSDVCGHYTQIVWRTTLRIGCGKATCPAGTSPFGNGQAWDLWVCDYDPPGNVAGQRPY
jgi:hypothetical protein